MLRCKTECCAECVLVGPMFSSRVRAKTSRLFQPVFRHVVPRQTWESGRPLERFGRLVEPLDYIASENISARA